MIITRKGEGFLFFRKLSSIFMASAPSPFGFFILLGAAVLVLTAASVSCTSVDHMPSTEEEEIDYAKLKSKTQQAKNEMQSKTQQAANEVKGKTQQAKEKASEMEKEAKESTESWTEWAKEKISEGLGFKQDDTKDSDSLPGTATKAKEKAQEVASG